jgi:hypothetical protein
MSSRKRVSVSPGSVATSKRRSGSSDQSDLLCLICHELVVDATQSICCGTLHCRSCISQWLVSHATCPNCRKPLSDERVVPDARCERLSAAHVRQCAFEEHGCKFEGNRASTAAHEKECEFVPLSFLREKIKIVKRKKKQTVQVMAQQIQEYEKLVAFHEIMERQLMKSALGPDPAQNAIRTLYGFSPSKFVAQVKRQDVINEIEPFFAYPQISVAFRMIENNHNVAMLFRRDDDESETPSLIFDPGQRLTVRLLHPYDELRAKTVSFDLTKLNTSFEEGFPNFMTSAQLDEYCVAGSYFIA